jgi:intracellular multiplication protein IcmL
LVLAQSWVIMLLVVLTILTFTVFAPKTIYHLVILDKQGVPTKLFMKGNPPKEVPGQYFYPPYLLQALDEPNLTHTAILNMAENVVTQVLTFGFNNADERLLGMRHLFTKEAWNYFGRAYLQQGRLDLIKRNQQVLTAVATAGPVVVSEGMVDDVDRWVVQVPIVTTFQAGKSSSTKRSVLQVTLVRASTLEHPEGVAIAGWEELAAGLGVRQGWGGD